MRPLAATLLIVLPAVLTGCAQPNDDADGADADPRDARVEAPWWPVGAWWDIAFTQAGVGREVRMVNFLNDSDHFWLGVDDRAAALDHALHDTNPFLGRVHWVLLAPHEGNRHAQMYRFPLTDGETYTSGNPFFGRNWDLAIERQAGEWRVTGTSADGATVAYDYDPATEWFSELRIREPDGSPGLVADVRSSGDDATGTYWFFRGRDYHEGPEVGGTHDERFEVKQEERPVAFLVVEVDGTTTAPVRLDFIDAAGVIRHTETLTGGAVRRTVEIPGPHAPGTWTVRYLGTGELDGRVDVTGILEYTATL